MPWAAFWEMVDGVVADEKRRAGIVDPVRLTPEQVKTEQAELRAIGMKAGIIKHQQ